MYIKIGGTIPKRRLGRRSTVLDIDDLDSFSRDRGAWSFRLQYGRCVGGKWISYHNVVWC